MSLLSSKIVQYRFLEHKYREQGYIRKVSVFPFGDIVLEKFQDLGQS